MTKEQIDEITRQIKDTKEYNVGQNIVEEMIKYTAEREQIKLDKESKNVWTIIYNRNLLWSINRNNSKYYNGQVAFMEGWVKRRLQEAQRWLTH